MLRGSPRGTPSPEGESRGEGGPNQSLLTSAATNWSDAAPLIELNEVLLKACHKDVRERYASADAMLADLELLQRGQSVQRKHAAERRWTMVKRMSLTAAAVVVLLAVLPYVKLGQRERNSALPAEITSLAVLPFANESTYAPHKYLSDALTDETMQALINITGLRVAPRQSVFAFKGHERCPTHHWRTTWRAHGVGREHEKI